MSSDPVVSHENNDVDGRANFSVVPEGGFDRKVSIMTYNVDNATREENVEMTKWVNRKERVAALVNKVMPDIVCFQELRDLPNNERVIEYLASQRFASYRFEIAWRNATSLPFAHAILFDPKKTLRITNSATVDFVNAG